MNKIDEKWMNYYTYVANRMSTKKYKEQSVIREMIRFLKREEVSKPVLQKYLKQHVIDGELVSNDRMNYGLIYWNK